MTDLLLLGHLLAVIVWVGSGFAGQALAFAAGRSGDDATLARLVGLIGRLTLTLFVPASLLALLTGVGLVVDGPASFGDPWIVVALAGFGATFAAGAIVLGPRAGALAAALAADGGAPSAGTVRQAQTILRIARIELAVLVLIVADMVLKPGA